MPQGLLDAKALLSNNFLRCPKDGGRISEEGICEQGGEHYDIRDGRIYFRTPPTDTDAPPRGRDGRDWSPWRKENLNFYKRALEGTSPTARVVDLGAGPSQFLELLSSFGSYLGVDFIPYEAVMVIGDLDGPLPLADSSADVVVLSNVLEHVSDPRPLLKECMRILAPGGRLVSTTPFLVRVHQAPYDFNRYTNFQHEKLLTDIGFVDIRVEPLGSPAFVYDTIERQYFTLLVDARPFKSVLANGLFHIAARVMRFAARASQVMARSFYRLVPANARMTEGYGASARKPGST